MNLQRSIITTSILLVCMIRTVLSRDSPIVNIPDQGQIMGVFLKMFRVQSIVAYLGIPYAQPPIDERRFAPPVVDPLPSWEGLRNGSQLASSCWSDNRQPMKNHDEIFYKILGIDPKQSDSSQFSEDCLYLNIYIPDEPPPKDGYAVMVWLHSGDFISGNASELNPFQLVFKQKVIVVTIAYRLSIFGFFTSMDGEAPGNFGLMDQSAALVWINQNIKLFSGNPKAITLMGHGSGAISAALHLTSGDWSDGLFQRVILMSGTSLDSNYVRDVRTYKNAIAQVADQHNCYKITSLMLTCLRRVDASNLMQNLHWREWTPVIDNQLSNSTPSFIPDYPKNIFERSNAFQKVPAMIGFTDMEDALDVSMREILDDGLTMEMYSMLTNDIVSNELAQLEANNETQCGDGSSSISNGQPVLDALDFVYKPYSILSNSPSMLRQKYINFVTERTYIAPAFATARALSRSTDVYMYRFDIKPKTQAIADMLPAWSGVPQRFDQIFVWGMPYWIILDNQTQWSTEDKRVSDIIMTMWANFAKFSNPTEFGVYIRWTNFSDADPGVLIIDRSFNMSDTTSLNYQGIQFWNDYYPKVMDFATQCCNATNSASSIFNFYKYDKYNYGEIQMLFLIATVTFCSTFHTIYND